MAIAGATTTTLASCASTPEKKEDNKSDLASGIILHAVYFWLKPGLSDADKADFLNFFEVLKTIPDCRYVTYGTPAPSNPRPVVENSFDYNLIVTVDSMDQLNIYEDHPIHQNAIAEYSKYWDKVMVHDTIIG